MELITVNNEKCTKDGLCIRECPVTLITAGPEGFPAAVENAAELCIGCGHCAAICPHGALVLKGTDPGTLLPVQEEGAIGGDALIHLMKSRRSVRQYKETPVPAEVLQKLLDAAGYAPTARNQQTLGWIVMERREVVHDLAKRIIEGLRQADFMPAMVKAFDEGRDVVFRGAPHLVITHAPSESVLPQVDCVIALTYFELAAWASGVGTCWAGFLMKAAEMNPAIERQLGIPEGRRLYGALMAGYPKIRYRRVPERKARELRWL
ncbi:MAG: nitroreductase family protein [Candidatus Eremiobacteraeota bacterium]|nr:nitroreductase family protein [Candidatus Eremiobacteraeota bacterium]